MHIWISVLKQKQKPNCTQLSLPTGKLQVRKYNLPGERCLKIIKTTSRLHKQTKNKILHYLTSPTLIRSLNPALSVILPRLPWTWQPFCQMVMFVLMELIKWLWNGVKTSKFDDFFGTSWFICRKQVLCLGCLPCSQQYVAKNGKNQCWTEPHVQVAEMRHWHSTVSRISATLAVKELTGGCTGSSESTLVKMTHCLKTHAVAQLCW